MATEGLKAPYFTADGKADGMRELPREVFDGVVHEAALYAAVKGTLANQRRGTASAKTRAEVSGGGRKPWRQKGTGRARQGTIRAPHWRGGGIVHPPKPRDWRQEVPKAVKTLARRSALNARARENALLVVEALTLETVKTRALVQWLARLGLEERNVLILTLGHRPDVVRAGRNLRNVRVRPFGQESSYDVLWADGVVVEEGALAAAAEPARAGRADRAAVRDA